MQSLSSGLALCSRKGLHAIYLLVLLSLSTIQCRKLVAMRTAVNEAMPYLKSARTELPRRAAYKSRMTEDVGRSPYRTVPTLGRHSSPRGMHHFGPANRLPPTLAILQILANRDRSSRSRIKS